MRTLIRIGLSTLAGAVALVMFATPANVSPPDLDSRIDAMRARILDLERDNALLRAHLDEFATRVNVNAELVDGLHRAMDAQRAQLSEQQARLEQQAAVNGDRRAVGPSPRSLELRVEQLEDLLAYFRREGDDVILEGANFHIRNGNGATDTFNGVGNLILGYNEPRETGNDRSGSHVIVLGARNNFSGFASIVSGHDNDVIGDWASVLGGTGNVALASYGVVVGGTGNRADGPFATVSGGVANQAIGEGASVAGGGFNVASGRYAVVGGGMRNLAEGDVSVVSRGCDTTVSTCGGD
jgi:hypothetical protein